MGGVETGSLFDCVPREETSPSSLYLRETDPSRSLVPRSPTEVKGGGRPGALVSQAHAYPRPPVRVRSRDSLVIRLFGLRGFARCAALRGPPRLTPRSRVEGPQHGNTVVSPPARRCESDVIPTHWRVCVCTRALFAYTPGARVGGSRTRLISLFLSISFSLLFLLACSRRLPQSCGTICGFAHLARR